MKLISTVVTSEGDFPVPFVTEGLCHLEAAIHALARIDIHDGKSGIGDALIMGVTVKPAFDMSSWLQEKMEELFPEMDDETRPKDSDLKEKLEPLFKEKEAWYAENSASFGGADMVDLMERAKEIEGEYSSYSVNAVVSVGGVAGVKSKSAIDALRLHADWLNAISSVFHEDLTVEMVERSSGGSFSFSAETVRKILEEEHMHFPYMVKRGRHVAGLDAFDMPGRLTRGVARGSRKHALMKALADGPVKKEEQ